MLVNNTQVIHPVSQFSSNSKTVGVENQLVQNQAQNTNLSYMPAYVPVASKSAQTYLQVAGKSILDNFSPDAFTRFRTNAVVQTATAQPLVWKNDLRQTFFDNKAVIYALAMRTFNAKDKNGNELIDEGEQSGTFLNAVDRLDELKRYGVNTLHLLPIHEPGKKGAKGNAGSLYAPKDFLSLDPALRDKNDPRSTKEQCKQFVDECHKRGIRVMVDLPSCASLEMYSQKPELMAIDERGLPEVPQGWADIRMLKPFADKDKRVLNKALVDYHKQYVDMCLELGIDGIRADVARAKPVEFWDEMISYARSKDPQFAFLAESYTYEDASPMLNMPYDRPKELLAAGFDSYYGQYHIFNIWKDAKTFHDYIKENLEMSKTLPKGKSLIGDFATHDDKSPMSSGGVPYCNMTTGLQATLPMTNPYFVSGFESGDTYLYPYKDQKVTRSDTDYDKYTLNFQWIDIFNYSRKPGGKNPEIGDYMHNIMDVRKQYEDVITKGSYIPLKVNNNKDDKVIAYARHYNGKTLLVVANKDVNAIQDGKVVIPGLKDTQVLKDLSPSYGVQSNYSISEEGKLNVTLGPARLHIFEIDTPSIETESKEVYRQNI